MDMLVKWTADPLIMFIWVITFRFYLGFGGRGSIKSPIDFKIDFFGSISVKLSVNLNKTSSAQISSSVVICVGFTLMLPKK